MQGIAYKKSQQGNAVVVLIGIIALLAIGIVSYMYLWEEHSNNVEPTPTIANLEIDVLPTPVNSASWQESSYNQNEVWSFRYPTDWVEEMTPGTYIYHPQDLEKSQFSLSFVKNLSPDKTLDELAQQVIVRGTIVDRQEFMVDGKEAVLLFHNNENAGTDRDGQQYGQSTVDVLISGISFRKGNQAIGNDKCWEHGILAIHVFYRNPPNIDAMPYEQDIKGILSTFDFTDCIENT